jgi:CheY-like chemotaxis protein
LRVFLVEDEALILMMTAEMVETLGHEVVAEASSIEKAVGPAKDARFDIAILDVNLAGARIDPIAKIIDERGLPFVFVSGYAGSALPEPFADRPHVQKPFLTQRLQEALEIAIKRQPGTS